MTKVIVYTCSHKRAVAKFGGEYFHLGLGGVVQNYKHQNAKCNGYIFRSNVKIQDSQTTVIRTLDANN